MLDQKTSSKHPSKVLPPIVEQSPPPSPSFSTAPQETDSPMDFHYPHGPRRATWAGEPPFALRINVPSLSTPPAFYSPSALHFRPAHADHLQTSALPPAFSHLEAAEALSGLASTYHLTDVSNSSSSASLASSSSLKRSPPPFLSLNMSTPAPSTSQSPPPESPSSAYRYEAFSQIPRLPPILQVEKTRVTTSATQAASAQRRRNDATFKCPVPGCGSTFTRRFNLRGHLRSHTEEKPYICSWPECAKGFARQHDCKRHQALHTSKSAHLCTACEKSFSRMDALNRHLRSSATCRQKSGKPAPAAAFNGTDEKGTAHSGPSKDGEASSPPTLDTMPPTPSATSVQSVALSPSTSTDLDDKAESVSSDTKSEAA